jgi:hypothetical protein
MTRMYSSLIAFDRRCESTDESWVLSKGLLLDLLPPFTLRPIAEPVVLPARFSEKRGNTAKNNPNFCYDTARYALSSDGPFLDYCLNAALAAGNEKLALALRAYIEAPVFSRPGLHVAPKGVPLELTVEGKVVKGEDWVVLAFGGTPMAAELISEYHRAREAQNQEGRDGICVVTGDRGPIARLHPAITFGPNGGSSTSMYSCNEGASESRGLKQGDNFPMTVANTLHYKASLKRIFQDSPFLTKTEAIALWPDEGTRQHPIVPLVRDLATRYFKVDERALVADLWRQIEAVTDLDATLHLAGLVHKMSRVSTRWYGTTTAGALQRNLLAFRDRFRTVNLPPTFRWLLPHSTRRGVPSISGVCLLDTAWAVLMGETYPPQLATPIRSRLKQIRQRIDWRTDDPDLSLCLQWLEILNPGKELPLTSALNTELSPRARAWIEESHEEIRRDLEDRMLVANSLLRADCLSNPAYVWGRFVAVCCEIKCYYHLRFGAGKRLPRPRDEALKRGQAQPRGFLWSYRPQRYLEQIRQRFGVKSPLVNTYACLFAELNDPPPAAVLTTHQKDLVTYGFLHQLDGLDKARTFKPDRAPLYLVEDLDDLP